MKVICMDEFIKLLDPAYELIQYRIKENKVIFHIASTITELECPFCGSKTSKVHSIYQREIQDLPMQGKKVILLVDTKNAMYESGLFSQNFFRETSICDC